MNSLAEKNCIFILSYLRYFFACLCLIQKARIPEITTAIAKQVVVLWTGVFSRVSHTVEQNAIFACMSIVFTYLDFWNLSKVIVCLCTVTKESLSWTIQNDSICNVPKVQDYKPSHSINLQDSITAAPIKNVISTNIQPSFYFNFHFFFLFYFPWCSLCSFCWP